MAEETVGEAARKAKKRAYMIMYRAKNAERIRETTKKWKDANREKVREYGRRGSRVYYAKDPAARCESVKRSAAKKRDAYKAKHAEVTKKWSEKNRVDISKRRKLVREANKPKIREQERARRQMDPDRYRSYTQNRRAKRLNAGGRHTKEEIQALLKRQKFKCAICHCGIRKNYERDHIQPIFLGGTNDIGNIQMTCSHCNRSKSYKDPIRFAQELGRLL